MIDQATRLRSLVDDPQSGAAAVVCAPAPAGEPKARISYGPPRARVVSESPIEATRFARAIAVTSGKGGVGKSNIAVNLAACLAACLAAHGRRVCLIDADLGLANADLLCNVTPRATLDDVVHRGRRPSEAVHPAPGGFLLLPGASGVARLADLSPPQRDRLLAQLAAIEQATDTIVIDTGAGISPGVLAFACAANTVLITTTPEPTAVTDAYGMIKAIHSRGGSCRMEVIVNMAEDERSGEAIYRRLDRVSRTFLHRALVYGGTVPEDPAVRAAVRCRTPFVLAAPKAPASRAVSSLARRLAGVEGVGGPGEARGFLRRLAEWIVR